MSAKTKKPKAAPAAGRPERRTIKMFLLLEVDVAIAPGFKGPDERARRAMRQIADDAVANLDGDYLTELMDNRPVDGFTFKPAVAFDERGPCAGMVDPRIF